MSERKDITTRQESMPERNIEIPTIAPLVDIFENDDDGKMGNRKITHRRKYLFVGNHRL